MNKQASRLRARGRVRLPGPRTPHTLLEGLRLAGVNLLLLLILGGGAALLFLGVSRLNAKGFPIPLPVGLVLLLVGIPYYIFFYQYGKSYGRLLSRRSFLRGLFVGILGQLPGVGLRLGIAVTAALHQGPWQVPFHILDTFLFGFTLVLPIMTALGSIDQKNSDRLP